MSDYTFDENNEMRNDSDRRGRDGFQGSRYNNSRGEGGFRQHREGGRDGFRPRGGGYSQRREGGDGYGDRRPRFGNNEGGDSQYGQRPRFNRNSQQGEYGRGGGYRNSGGQQGGYRPRFQQGNAEGGEGDRWGKRPSYGPVANNGYSNDDNRGERRTFRPNNYNNDGRGFRPRRNDGANGGGFRPSYGQQGDNRQNFRPGREGNYNPHAKYSAKKQLEYKEEHYDPNEPVRLNKFLANAGVCSRRDADKYIAAGVVTVNGKVVTELGTKVLRSDTVLFHDTPIKMEKKVYVLLNKPKGYVTTSEDPQNRKTVMELVANACRERIYPVGRLDRNTTGVLLFTNDGELASKLTHPQFMKKKIYHVFTDQNVSPADLRQIAEGITLEDGEIKADAIEYVDDNDHKQIGIEIHSGKNRIVRRIFEHLGYHVIKLDRVYFAGLTKKGVKRGEWRYLTEKEVGILKMGGFE